MTLRRRLGLTVAPLAALILAVGAAGLWLLDDLGRRSEAVLQENYVSIDAMTNLREDLSNAERLALFAVIQGDRLHPDVPAGFRKCVDGARRSVRVELNNITVPGEQQEADRLAAAVDLVAARGEELLAAPPAERHERYVDPDRGFQPAVTAAWRHLQAVRVLNEVAMEDADRATRDTARRSAWVLGGATAFALLLAGVAAAHLLRTILRPVDDLTRSAKAVGDGRLDLLVTADTRDEIGDLVAAFNRMTAQLRDLRQTEAARLLRAQQASQAAIDAFPDPVLVVDPGGRVEMANPAARQVLGVAAGDPSWVPPEKLHEPLAAALREQRPFLTQSFDAAVTYRAGAEDRVYLPQVLPVRDPYGATLGAAVVLTDVTRFRLLDEFKSDLVATTSHELKTPLAGLRLAVHLLLEEAVGPLTDKQTELLVDARENT
ncbi:MAG: HAMP domain-containing protein, partial [Gemmataceae bacterium]